MAKRPGEKRDFMQVAREVVEQAIGEKMDGGCALVHVLQFLPRASDIARHASDGSWDFKSCLDYRGALRTIARGGIRCKAR